MHCFGTISIIGLGYIGLPTATLFAMHGKHVIGVDINLSTIDTINRGEIHIIEPDLDIAVHNVVSSGHLRATTVPEPADAFLIAVPTPFRDNHVPDLSYIETACKNIAPVLKKGDLVILESTSPVGATEQMAQWLAQDRPDLTFPHTHGSASDIRLAHCPERVLPGQVMRELIDNDRIIGGMTETCSQAAKALYKTFVQGECILTDVRTAEMCKLTENSFRDVNIAFANELSIICDKLDIDVWELIRLANRHPRVNILQPGPGVGGHCIAVDPWFIVDKTPEEARLIKTAREVNDAKPDWVINQIKQALGEFLLRNPGKCANDVNIACFGLTFKPDIDDLRESPSLHIIKRLETELKRPLWLVEPNITHLPDGLHNHRKVGIEEALESADIFVLLVNHQEFHKIELPAGAQVVDAAGVLVHKAGETSSWRREASFIKGEALAITP